MILFINHEQHSGPRHRRAFTLIELMLVMVLLTIVISLVVPQLETFFAGRTLNSEVQQFVALTHYGQSRAASEGVPMLLWVDPGAGQYGLEQEPGYNDTDPKSVEYSVGEGVKIGIPKNGIKAVKRGKMQGIHFSPDGNVVKDTSLASVFFQEGKHAPVIIGQTANGLSYEVQN
ncbi:MAG TPA: prepilin-type N-terminal cleavage/methylation domain-containing protein [Verrucomicrobiae bacterium]|jgi:prepilin-type N-terminal cleavage/methylation domain-containing protein|nr:prepilin-type N-terminal cleavage/methylation domain-containing protein [Verrucomicrobiae bacterium]